VKSPSDCGRPYRKPQQNVLEPCLLTVATSLVPVRKLPELGPSHADAKAWGAFYTDAQIAEFLAWWGVRDPNETVFDPSFGGGVFLRAAAKRISALGGTPRGHIHGVELDPFVHSSISKKLGDEFAIPSAHILQGDFFQVSESEHGTFSVVLGNPPFIRYQKFNGESRAVALRHVAALGVKLSELSSAWAPFLVASISRVRLGGRLAMVAPMELCHASYARPVLEFLGRSFERVTFLSFEQPLFPDLSEGAILLLAENRGDHRAQFQQRDFRHPGALAKLVGKEKIGIPSTEPLDSERLLSGQERFIEYLIPDKARMLYAELRGSDMTVKLGSIADVGIGYVSGANGFFHVGPETIKKWNIPGSILKPIIRRSRGLRGITLTKSDWRQHLQSGEASYLLHIEDNQQLTRGVSAYIQAAEAEGIHLGYKCRNRSPWYCVPHVHRPDAFLSYMSTRSPRLVFNNAEVFAPNSLHVLRFNDGTGPAARNLACAWQTSLSRLSCELQGHALGGGMLKMEPTEAENAVLPRFLMREDSSFSLSTEIDSLLRSGKDEEAHEVADKTILREKLNLTKTDCSILNDAVAALQRRRL
jgi:adenine-specific DNA-methyltransferase